ncbi:LPS export ABC transporter periplasmic protein LptC [Thalassovita taeanensis]|uniref:Lipopolysaccharide export system protein LptC n=1 Tax=Thalassovita taeanensis TaxID=657014 RepID=A0A1H9BVN8_9RHOB|nr:LPS export ABC transporter periplasmic protein LptC [Thalassovita taeanensis]SEP92821.1 lipopolysaccharide export system protein LptC [Thalassovita taeanensis]
MWRDRFHSRIVAWLKIILPLAALVLLSTLFLLSRSRDPSTTIPFSQIDLQERARDEIVTEPQFSGATANGDLISFTAASARPDPTDNNKALAQTLSAKIDLTSGTRITFTAESARLDTKREMAELTGGVIISSSTGYVVRTDTLITSMSEIGAETMGTITGEGPVGTLSAGKMLLTSNRDTNEAQLLFTNRVKLVYQP